MFSSDEKEVRLAAIGAVHLRESARTAAVELENIAIRLEGERVSPLVRTQLAARLRRRAKSLRHVASGNGSRG